MRLDGLSYGYSIAYPMRRSKKVWNSEALQCVLEFVHIGNLCELPPDPSVIAYRGVQIGLASSRDDFVKTVWY